MYGAEFQNLSFTKKGHEVAERASALLKEKAQKILEKRSQIDEMCREHKITAERLLGNLDSFRGHSSAELPSAEMQKLQKLATDVDHLEKECARLSLITRNLKREQEFDLSFSELEYFKF